MAFYDIKFSDKTYNLYYTTVTEQRWERAASMTYCLPRTNVITFTSLENATDNKYAIRDYSAFNSMVCLQTSLNG